MASFNAELNASLDRLHPKTREFIDQSLRGGTQTPGHLFPAGLPLVAKLKQRIDEAVARYIAELDENAGHPLLSRRAERFPLFRGPGRRGFTTAVFMSIISIPMAGSAPATMCLCRKP